MSDERFEVVFRGDIVAGQSLVEVKQRLADLFKVNAERIDKMFSGRPVVVKRDLDKSTAERYQSSLINAGALVDVRQAEAPKEDAHSIAESLGAEHHADPVSESNANLESEPYSSSTQHVVNDVDFDVAPVGADVLANGEKNEFVPRDVDTSAMTVAEAGSDVLADEDKKAFVPKDVDTSGLSIDEPD